MTDATRRIGERLGGAFAIAVVLVALAGLSAIIALHTVKTTVIVPPDRTWEVEALRTAASRMITAGRTAAITHDPLWTAGRDAESATFQQALARLRGELTGPMEKQAADTVARREQDLDLAVQREALGTVSVPYADVGQRQAELDQALNSLATIVENERVHAAQRSYDAVARARRSATTGAGAAILLGAGLAFLLIRRFLREFDAAQAAVRARERFLRVASQELSRPLSSLAHEIVPLHQALHRKESTPPEAVTRGIDAASREIARLTSLVDELHAASVGPTPVRAGAELTDLTAVARDVAQRFENQLRHSGTTLTVQSFGPVLGQWDRSQLEQLVQQLLSNAVRHGGGKPVKITIEGGDPARLLVRDHGPGIPREVTERLFQPFDAPDETRRGTLGLGLYISRQIVLSYGGNIRAESMPGIGTTMVVELPRKRRAPPQRRPFGRLTAEEAATT